MAKLIKLRLKPHKHVLLHALSITKPNRIIPFALLNEQNAQREKLREEMLLTRAKVSEFCAKKATIVSLSSARGRDRAERELVTEVLVSCAFFMRSLSSESAAIDNLARKIAANITSRPDLFEPQHDANNPNISVLATMMRVIIAAPAAQRAQAELLLGEIGRRFGLVMAFEASNDERAELRVLVANTTTVLDFNPISLLRILKSVNMRLEIFDQGLHNKNMNPL